MAHQGQGIAHQEQDKHGMPGTGYTCLTKERINMAYQGKDKHGMPKT